MPASGPALTFDPRYVEFVIAAWRERQFAAYPAADLHAAAARYAAEVLAGRNSIGFADEHPKENDINRAIALLKSLQITKERKVGPKNAKVTRIAPTSEGRTVLSDAPATGGLRPQLVGRLVASSAALRDCLRALDRSGPLTVPVIHVQPGAPKSGKRYQALAADGLALFWELPAVATIQHPKLAAKTTPAQAIKAATAAALAAHPLGIDPKLEKVLPLAAALGLLWTNTVPLNAVIARRTIGLAATENEATYLPNAPAWDEIVSRFLPALLRAHELLENGSGFATIDELRGAIGQELALSAPVVDALICQARERGDLHQLPIRLHFEEDEESVYQSGRVPLVWQEHAFDFIAVIRSPETSPFYDQTRVSPVKSPSGR